MRSHPLTPHDDFVPKDHNKVQRDSEIAGDEVLGVEIAVRRWIGDEDVEVLANG